MTMVAMTIVATSPHLHQYQQQPHRLSLRHALILAPVRTVEQEQEQKVIQAVAAAVTA
jgi:hypothetical protein